MARERDISIVTTVVAVNLITTAETVIISSNPVLFPYDQANVLIIAYAQLTTGTSTTAVTPRIRRGVNLTDPLVGGANAETLKAAAGGTEPFIIHVAEFLSGRGQAVYSLTLQQTGAAANGSAVQATIHVIVT